MGRSEPTHPARNGKLAERKAAAIRVLEHLNAKVGRSGRDAYRGKAALTAIMARLAEFSEAELCAMVSDRVGKWAGKPDMVEYLRPSTLFRAGKCADYTAQARQTQPIPRVPTRIAGTCAVHGDVQWQLGGPGGGGCVVCIESDGRKGTA